MPILPHALNAIISSTFYVFLLFALNAMVFRTRFQGTPGFTQFSTWNALGTARVFNPEPHACIECKVLYLMAKVSAQSLVCSCKQLMYSHSYRSKVFALLVPSFRASYHNETEKMF